MTRAQRIAIARWERRRQLVTDTHRDGELCAMIDEFLAGGRTLRASFLLPIATPCS